MRVVSAQEAIGKIQDGSRVVLHQGCAAPLRLQEALVDQAERLRNLKVYLGLQFGECGLWRHFRCASWHITAPLRPLVAEGAIRYLPVRYREVVRLFAADGPLPVDVLLLQVSPPDDLNRVSLGVSVGPFLELARQAKLVIAELNDQMPRTCGNSTLPLSCIDYAVETSHPLTVHCPATIGPVEKKIAASVSELIPEGAWVQLGIGSVPEALLASLSERRIHLHTGIVSDGVIKFAARGRRKVITGEVAGSEELFDFVHENPQIELHPSSCTHNPDVLRRLPNFVAINSAVEVDLTGQVNSESVGGHPVGGVGGGLDFIEGARLSPGGRVIIALTALGPKGRSRIVPTLSQGAAVTIPRACVDYVVTEHGIARLWGKSLDERAEALIQIADPRVRDGLWERWRAEHGTG